MTFPPMRLRAARISAKAMVTAVSSRPEPENATAISPAARTRPLLVCYRQYAHGRDSRSIQSGTALQPILLQPEPQIEISSLDSEGSLRDAGSTVIQPEVEPQSRSSLGVAPAASA